MKKVFSLLAVLALVCMATSAWAAKISNIVKTAKVTFTADTLNFDVKLYTWTEGKAFNAYTTTDEASYISFETGDVTLASSVSKFARGTVFAKISSTNLNQQSANVQLAMYTDNTNSTNYEAKAPRTEDGKTKYNGLVRKNMGDEAVEGDYAPIEMKNIKVSDASSYASTRPTEDDFPLNGQAESGVRYLLDAQDQDFSKTGNVGVTSTSIGKGGMSGGIWVSGNYNGSNSYVNEDVLIFFGARFKNVVGGDEYGTDKIIFEQFAE